MFVFQLFLKVSLLWYFLLWSLLRMPSHGEHRSCVFCFCTWYSCIHFSKSYLSNIPISTMFSLNFLLYLLLFTCSSLWLYIESLHLLRSLMTVRNYVFSTNIHILETFNICWTCTWAFVGCLRLLRWCEVSKHTIFIYFFFPFGILFQHFYFSIMSIMLLNKIRLRLSHCLISVATIILLLNSISALT